MSSCLLSEVSCQEGSTPSTAPKDGGQLYSLAKAFSCASRNSGFFLKGKFNLLSVFYTLLRKKLLDLFLRSGCERGRKECYMKELTESRVGTRLESSRMTRLEQMMINLNQLTAAGPAAYSLSGLFPMAFSK